MQNQRGFIGIGVLIAILVGLAVLGGGAYYVVHQETPSQTVSDNFDNVQTLPTTKIPPPTTVKTPVKTANPEIKVTTQTRNGTCPSDVKDFLNSVGLHINNPSNFPTCYVDETVQYESGSIPIYYVAYDERPALDGPAQSYVFVATFPSGKSELLPDKVRLPGTLYDYLESTLNQPFNIDGFNVSDIVAKKELIRKNSQLCFRLTMKYPLSGLVEQCSSGVSGNVAYSSGVLSWNEAKQLALQECEKYPCAREPNRMIIINDRFISTHGGEYQLLVNTALRNADNPLDAYYVFIGKYRDGGEEGVVLIKVYFGGRVESTKVHTTETLNIDYILQKIQ